MRHTIAVVAMLFILAAGLIMPAAAGGFDAVQSTTSSSTSLGWSLPIFLESDMRAPAGRITIWFSNREYGEPLFYYIGSSRELLVGDDIPAFRWCIAKVELTGAYANQVVRSSWGNLGGMESNTFAAQICPGVQEARFFIQGRKKQYLRIAFLKIEVGSSGFTTEQSFRVVCQGSDGLTDYKCQREVAQASWPCAGEELQGLWATLFVYESWYRSQGLVIAGTEAFPRNTTSALRDFLEVRQRQADAQAQAAETAAAEAEYQRKLADAEAARKAAEERRAADAAEYQRKLADAEAARKAAEERLANPPAPVTTTITTTETAVETAQPRPATSPTLCSWRFNLPPGKVVCVETLDQRGERRYPKRYSGYIPFNNYVVGQSLCVRLTWEGASAPDPWKVVRDVQPGMVVNYQDLEVR